MYTVREIKEILANKRPVVQGIEIFYDFPYMRPDNYRVPLPGQFTYSLGSHAVLIMGYDDSQSSFLIKNSYGKNWGIMAMPGFPTNMLNCME